MNDAERGFRDRSALARRRAASARDAGLDVVGRTTRWMIAGAVIVAAGLSALTAHAFHARAASSSHAAASTTQQSSPSQSSGDDGSTTPLQSPSQAPAATAPAPAAPVVSGGS